jgi:uncharacterized integral membrane protein
METTTDGRDARGASRIFLRPIGSPLPLGMAALAALVQGIVFQYSAIAPMRGLSLRKGLIKAAKRARGLV